MKEEGDLNLHWQIPNSLAPPPHTIYPMGGMIRFLCAFQIGPEKISPSDVLIIEHIGLQFLVRAVLIIRLETKVSSLSSC